MAYREFPCWSIRPWLVISGQGKAFKEQEEPELEQQLSKQLPINWDSGGANYSDPVDFHWGKYSAKGNASSFPCIQIQAGIGGLKQIIDNNQANTAAIQRSFAGKKGLKDSACPILIHSQAAICHWDDAVLPRREETGNSRSPASLFHLPCPGKPVAVLNYEITSRPSYSVPGFDKCPKSFRMPDHKLLLTRC